MLIEIIPYLLHECPVFLGHRLCKNLLDILLRIRCFRRETCDEAGTVALITPVESHREHVFLRQLRAVRECNADLLPPCFTPLILRVVLSNDHFQSFCVLLKRLRLFFLCIKQCVVEIIHNRAALSANDLEHCFRLQKLHHIGVSFFPAVLLTDMLLIVLIHTSRDLIDVLTRCEERVLVAPRHIEIFNEHTQITEFLHGEFRILSLRIAGRCRRSEPFGNIHAIKAIVGVLDLLHQFRPATRTFSHERHTIGATKTKHIHQMMYEIAVIAVNLGSLIIGKVLFPTGKVFQHTIKLTFQLDALMRHRFHCKLPSLCRSCCGEVFFSCVLLFYTVVFTEHIREMTFRLLCGALYLPHPMTRIRRLMDWSVLKVPLCIYTHRSNSSRRRITEAAHGFEVLCRKEFESVKRLPELLTHLYAIFLS